MNSELLIKVESYARALKQEHKMLRVGHSLMNALFKINPEIYHKITNSESDCFYNDSKIENFYHKL